MQQESKPEEYFVVHSAQVSIFTFFWPLEVLCLFLGEERVVFPFLIPFCKK